MAQAATSVLIGTYLDRRDALVRYFTLRTGSAARAEDLVQDIYLKLTTMDEAGAAGVQNPAAFLYRLGSNLMLDRLKAEKRGMARDAAWREGQTLTVAGEDAADIPAADDALAAKQRLAIVIEALEELSPNTRRAFRLHKFEGLSHAETAARMGLSRSAIEKHVSAALKHLMRRLE